MKPLHKLLTYIRDERAKARGQLYYDDTREIQYAIGRPLSGRELQVIFEMSDNQIYMIKKWVRESKNNESK